MKLSAVIIAFAQLFCLSASIPAYAQYMTVFVLGDCYVRQVPCYKTEGGYFCKTEYGTWVKVLSRDAFSTAKEAIKEFYIREDARYGKKSEVIRFYTYDDKRAGVWF